MADVSEEVARAELQRWFDAMDIDVNESELDEDDNSNMQMLVKNVVQGRLIIDKDGQPSFTPKVSNDGAPITFREPTGATYMAMDKVRIRKDGKQTETADQKAVKMFRAMADMTGLSVSTFANMKNRDLQVCMAIAAIFLAG